MNERLAQLRQQLQTFWLKLSFNQKLLLGAGVLMLTIALLMLARAAQPNYVPLFSDLEPGAAGDVTAKLEEMQIPYQLADGGSTILVPEKDKYQTRIKLANQGLPKGVVGFEIFNETKFGETDTDKKVRFLMALQGELTRTIESMSEVENAAVHIAMPEKALFSEEDQPVTASVMLKLKPGAKLSDSQVRGLVHFVASGVERLKPENVTIIDVSGKILSEGLADQTALGTGQLTASQMEIRKLFEQDLEHSIQTMLEKIIGSGKAVVRASAVLDFDQIEITQETWGDRVERAVQESTESGRNTGLGAGVPGTDSNIPGMVETGEQGSEWEKTDISRTYEIDREQVHQLVAPGTIKKLSVAVVIDGELEEGTLANIEQAVTIAAGIDEERGDQITISAVPFDRSEFITMQQEMEAVARNARLRTYITYGAAALAAIFAFVVLLVAARRVKGRMVDYSLGEVAVAMEEPQREPGQELTPEEKRRVAVKEQVEKLVRENPEDVAQLVKTWLIEDTR